MASVAFSEDQYYEKIASVQQTMHEREKRRLELERELFAYSLSDKRISQIKCAKLRSYLKEICERETRAKMRNLELLRDVECIEMSMKEHGPDRGPLRQQKVAAPLTRYLDDSRSPPAKNFQRPPAAIFMGRQTSRGSAAEAAATSVPSHRASHRSPNRCTHSPERLPSGLLKDFRVCGEAATDNRAHLSDDISGSNDSPDSCNLSDKHEREAAVLPSVRGLTGAAGGVPFGGDDEQAPSPPVTLAGPEKNASSPSGVSPMRAENSLAEYTDSKEVVHQPLITERAEIGLSCSIPEPRSEEESRDAPGRRESVSTPSSSARLSVSSASDLSISLTESELEEDLPEDVAHLDTLPTTRVAHEGSATPGGSDDRSLWSRESSVYSGESKTRPQVRHASVLPEATSERLSHEGLFHLLENIEGRLHGERTNVYCGSSIDGRKLDEMISFCNSGASLNDEDLEACGAVVLRELQRLSWSTAKGCLLPQDLVSAHWSSTQPKEISSSLPPDAARLWDRWFKHALLLKEQHVLSTQRLLQLFTPLLLERHATYSHQAKALLRTLLSRSSEECPSAEEESDLSPSSSCGLPSPLADGRRVQPPRPAEDRGIPELQSAEEDSQDESPAESIPIRETKAYQLLKQSATQERLQSSGEEEEEEEENGSSGINDGHEEDPGRAKRSSHQDPYPRKEKTRGKAFSAVQSKAFWGESDDSDSDIEAALRPQPLNTNNDDFDDFYD
ncbi:centrosomal protein kizuna isoform 2-T2 [Polymixia lowei]